MAAFSSNIDITNGGTYAMNITNGERYSKVMTDLNNKMSRIQSYLQNNLPETYDSLPTSLPHGKLIIYNNQLYFGNSSSVPTKVSSDTVPSHNHSASNITSGTLSTSRLPTIPINKGGTNATTASSALSNLGAFPIAGGTITGNLTVNGETHLNNTKIRLGKNQSVSDNNPGTVINIGDGDYIHFSEPTDDNLEIKAKNINFVVTGDVTKNGTSLGGTTSHTHDEYAPKASPVFTGSISLARKSGTTVGTNSVAIGSDVTASGGWSHAEGANGIASGKCSHVEGGYFTDSEGNKASEYAAHAEGSSTTASGKQSHAEGGLTTASGLCSHAEGYSTTAEGAYSHAEGHQSYASGDYSHAEGKANIASGFCSHAEGNGTEACNEHTHAEGFCTEASGDVAHAEGLGTTASNCASHAGGHYNKSMTNGGTSNNTAGDAFVIGNGIEYNDLSNCFRVTYTGLVYGCSSFKTTGADYAEYFEWSDGNPNNEDRVGYFVTLDNDKIKIANPNDYILGIVSGQPCIIGNADEDWLGRWQHDEYGRFVMEYLEEEKTEISTEGLSEEEINALRMELNVRKENDKLYRITSKVVDYETPSYRFKANPDYDSTQEYVERKDRKEWDAIGMVGVLSVRDDGTCKVNGYCKVADGGIATESSTRVIGETWRVIERVAPNAVKIIYCVM